MTSLASVLDALRRWPDVEAPNLVAVDAADRLLLDTAAVSIRSAQSTGGAGAASTSGEGDESSGGGGAAPGTVAVIGDGFGALTLGLLELGARDIRTHQDPLLGERALSANAERLGLSGFVSHGLTAELVEDAALVLLRLPKSLDQLDEWAQLIAAHAAPDVVVLAGGMVKHMTLAQNEVLARHFGSVQAGLARQKARVVTASAPRASAAAPVTWPRTARLDPPGLTVVAHGGVFAGAALDIGTRFLLEHLDDAAPQAAAAIDLGCGTGVLAAALAQARPAIRVHASDQSAAAVASARATMQANGLADRVTVVRDDALGSLPEASAELILLNPPFHTGTTVTADVGIRLIADAARVLAPGGELRVVFNSHLRYQPTLRRLVGATRQVARNSKFTITSSIKGA
ncbi:MAG: class I SAM-dependent methyltransferase [Microbacteriaceae bacterium]|nr:class I SAM-dependent methyltransferase [Microbacteriaceae bacterium]MCL2793903.1 class I SAM-dependent methyltransferase [Microbacteriaceae bacterium]